MDRKIKIGDRVVSEEYGTLVGTVEEINLPDEVVINVGSFKDDIIYCSLSKCRLYWDRYENLEIQANAVFDTMYQEMQLSKTKQSKYRNSIFFHSEYAEFIFMDKCLQKEVVNYLMQNRNLQFIKNEKFEGGVYPQYKLILN
jgi:hypothetical protein